LERILREKFDFSKKLLKQIFILENIYKKKKLLQKKVIHGENKFKKILSNCNFFLIFYNQKIFLIHLFKKQETITIDI